MKQSKIKFIPAKESGWFIYMFDLYTRTLFWRRFKKVWIDQEYQPDSTSKTIYYLNHTSWWDGLIPLLLNQKLFRQNARAMMEDKQMRKYRFFKKIGAFSVNLENPKAAIHSLRYAVKSMERPHSSLFIYPEGEIIPFSTGKPTFQKGLRWIVSQCRDVDVVPIGIYINNAKSDKPELFLKISEALDFDPSEETEELNSFFEMKLSEVLKELQANAHFKRDRFFKL